MAEQEKSVRNALAQLVGTLAKHELGQRGGGWPELLQLILAKVGSEAGQDRVLGVMMVAVLGEVAGEQRPFSGEEEVAGEEGGIR